MPMIPRSLNMTEWFDTLMGRATPIDDLVVWWAAALRTLILVDHDPESTEALLWVYDQDTQELRLFVNTAAADHYERSIEFFLSVLQTSAIRWAVPRPDRPPPTGSLLRCSYPQIKEATMRMAFHRN